MPDNKINKAVFLSAREHLKQNDERFAEIINKANPDEILERTSDAFVCLARAIISQQISVKAAESIWKKLTLLLNQKITPETILKLETDPLRTCGLSRSKISYLKNVAEFLNQNNIDQLPNPREALIKIKGIGPWTCDMFSIFYLLEPNILPLSDLGLIRAVEKFYFDGNRISTSEILRLSALWQPYCSIATWYLWRAIDGEGVNY